MAGKKVLGCLGIVATVVLVAVVLTYSFVYRPFREGLASLEEIHQANERIENREPYGPPEDGELQPEQVERFVAVQKQISENLEDELALLQKKYEEMEEKLEDRDPGIRELFTAWGDVLQLYADAKNVQIDALNEHDFSLEEYEFVKQAFYNALEHELIPFRLDAIAEAAKQRDFDIDLEKFEREPREISEEARERNQELISEYAEDAEEWLFFAWWGL